MVVDWVWFVNEVINFIDIGGLLFLENCLIMVEVSYVIIFYKIVVEWE